MKINLKSSSNYLPFLMIVSLLFKNLNVNFDLFESAGNFYRKNNHPEKTH